MSSEDREVWERLATLKTQTEEIHRNQEEAKVRSYNQANALMEIQFLQRTQDEKLGQILKSLVSHEDLRDRVTEIERNTKENDKRALVRRKVMGKAAALFTTGVLSAAFGAERVHKIWEWIGGDK